MIAAAEMPKSGAGVAADPDIRQKSTACAKLTIV